MTKTTKGNEAPLAAPTAALGGLRERIRRLLNETRREAAGLPALAPVVAGVDSCLERLGRHETVLMVLGETTKGKSELINGLIGDRLLPTNPRPTTMVPHRLRWGPELRIRVEGDPTGPRHLSRADLAGFNDGVTADDDGLRIEIEHPSTFLQGGLVIVDTPGVNDINLQKEEILFRDLPAADGALMVFDSRYVLTKSEATFLGDNLPETCRDRLLLVLSKIDRLDQAERAEVLDWTREGLDKIALRAPFFPVSAREALDGTSDGGLEPLRAAVTDLLALGGGGFVLENLLVRFGETLGRTVSDLTFRVRALEAGGVQAAERRAKLGEEMGLRRGRAHEAIDTFRAELADARDALVAELKLFAFDFQKALPEAIEGATAEDVKTYLPFFIRDTFKDWLTAAMPATEGRIQEAATRAVDELTSDVAELRGAAGLGEADGPGVKLAFATGVSGYDIGVAVLSVMGGIGLFVNLLAGGLLTAAAAVAAMQFRRERDAEVVAAARTEAPKAVEDTWRRLETTLMERFATYEHDVAERLRGLFDDEVLRLRTALDEAVAVAEQSGVELETVRGDCRAALDRLAVRQAELTALRRDVAGQGAATTTAPNREERTA